MPAHDVNVYGKTVNRTYHVNYYVDNELIYSDIYEFDQLINPRPDYVRYGYKVGEWGEIDRRMPAHDINLYVTLEKNSYKVNYYIGEELVYTDTVVFGENIVPYAPAAKNGYTFGGWNSLPSIMQAEDVTVSGSYVPNKYTVSYYVNDRFYRNVDLEYGATVDLAGFESDNYKVVGWTLNGNAVNILTVGAENIRLDAVVEDTTDFLQTTTFAVIAAVVITAVVVGMGAAIVIIASKKRANSL